MSGHGLRRELDERPRDPIDSDLLRSDHERLLRELECAKAAKVGQENSNGVIGTDPSKVVGQQGTMCVTKKISQD
jgi:hypothetical protein